MTPLTRILLLIAGAASALAVTGVLWVLFVLAALVSS